MRTIRYAILGMVFASCASAADKGTLSLKLAVLNPSMSDQVEVRVTTTNGFGHPVTYYNTNLCNYSFKVIAVTGTTVQETEDRKSLHCGSKVALEISGRNIAVTLKPGESSSEDRRLLDYNNVSQPGVYSVQAERTFPGIGHFRSNALKIDVQP